MSGPGHGRIIWPPGRAGAGRRSFLYADGYSVYHTDARPTLFSYRDTLLTAS